MIPNTKWLKDKTHIVDYNTMVSNFMDLLSMREFGTKWRDIIGFPGYMVSEQGFVVNTKSWNILTPRPNKKDQEWEVSLKRDNKYYKMPVDWLVKIHHP